MLRKYVKFVEAGGGYQSKTDSSLATGTLTMVTTLSQVEAFNNNININYLKHFSNAEPKLS